MNWYRLEKYASWKSWLVGGLVALIPLFAYLGVSEQEAKDIVQKNNNDPVAVKQELNRRVNQKNTGKQEISNSKVNDLRSNNYGRIAPIPVQLAQIDYSQLHPAMRDKVAKFLSLVQQDGIRIKVTTVWRSPKRQLELYQQGRSKPGKKVTWLKEGLHNKTIDGKPASLAIDIVPVDVHGKPIWSTQGKAMEVWNKLGELGMESGLQWGGNWNKTKDYPHFQISL